MGTISFPVSHAHQPKLSHLVFHNIRSQQLLALGTREKTYLTQLLIGFWGFLVLRGKYMIENIFNTLRTVIYSVTVSYIYICRSPCVIFVFGTSTTSLAPCCETYVPVVLKLVL